jgi:hypothetical protein
MANVAKAADAVKEKLVTEFALVQKLPGGERQGLFSHTNRAIVEHIQTIKALEGVSDTEIVQRDCSYPLDGAGNVIHHASKVKETVVAALAFLAIALLVFAFPDAGSLLALAAMPPAVTRRVFVGRGYTERVNFINGQALNVGGATAFSKEFKMGAGWYEMWLHFAFAFTVGTGTTALSDATWRIVRKIMLKTDRGELVCNEGARALAYIATYRSGQIPQRTTFAAANGTYHVFLPLYFWDPSMTRPQDTVLDTARYESVDLEVQLGTVSDLLGTVGTSSVTCTLDVDVERSYGKLPDKAKPHYFISYDHRPPQDPSVNPNIEMEKSPDMSIKRLYLWTADTGLAGVPWSGNANDTYPVKTNIQDQDRFIEKDRLHSFVQAFNKEDGALETQMAGVEVYDWVRDGSITSALATGEKSSLQVALTQSGAAATANFTATHEAVRLLKA